MSDFRINEVRYGAWIIGHCRGQSWEYGGVRGKYFAYHPVRALYLHPGGILKSDPHYWDAGQDKMVRDEIDKREHQWEQEAAKKAVEHPHKHLESQSPVSSPIYGRAFQGEQIGQIVLNDYGKKLMEKSRE